VILFERRVHAPDGRRQGLVEAVKAEERFWGLGLHGSIVAWIGVAATDNGTGAPVANEGGVSPLGRGFGADLPPHADADGFGDGFEGGLDLVGVGRGDVEDDVAKVLEGAEVLAFDVNAQGGDRGVDAAEDAGDVFVEVEDAVGARGAGG
jgi:hypothetical protein